MIRSAFILLLIALVAPLARAEEVIPPAPQHYFNDYTSTVSASAAQAIDDKLAQFERDTSNQVWVVMYPTMQSDSSIEDYTIRIAEKWKVGQKKRDNGVVLFIFKNDHKMRIEVGYGLEGALPDITARQIMDNDIAPRLKANDYAGGINAGVDSIIAATKGEYKGRPTAQRRCSQLDASHDPLSFFHRHSLHLLRAVTTRRTTRRCVGTVHHLRWRMASSGG